jgi:hypothetical protein
MGLGGLHRHRRIPTAAALVGVLLYTALVTSHIVSQATFQPLTAQAGHSHFGQAAKPNCHEPTASTNKSKTSDPSGPASPQRTCPFCSGYAILHIAVAEGVAGTMLPVGVAPPQMRGFDQAYAGRTPRTPQNRGPPLQLI